MVSPQGGATADLMTNSITASSNEMSRTLLREALQNSCDQRLSQSSAIDFTMEVKKFAPLAVSRLRELFQESGRKEASLRVKSFLSGADPYGLQIVDAHTKGLSGNIDASLSSHDANFARFFFKIGRPSSEQIGGGSYGLGRSIFLAASECDTVVVYSRFRDGSELKSRLMGMTFSPTFINEGREYSGRHWWASHVDEDKVTYPFEGDLADEIAADIGLMNNFRHESGTSILVLGPKPLAKRDESHGQTPMEFMRDLQRASEVFAWPHYVDKSVNFEFISEGVRLPQANPKSMATIREFVDAYIVQSTARSEENVRDKIIEFAGNDKSYQLGRLTWSQTVRNAEDVAIEEQDGIPVNSVALMRNARFIVKYLPVTGMRDGLTTRGVFISDPSFEEVFRKSEPVAHDDWLPAKLGRKKGERNEIRQALEKIAREFRSMGDQHSGGADSDLVGLEIATRLGQLGAGIGILGGPSAPPSGPPSGIRSGRIAKILEVGEPRLVFTDGKIYRTEFDFQLTSDLKQDHCVLVSTGIRNADNTTEFDGVDFCKTISTRSRTVSGAVLSDSDVAVGDIITATLEAPIEVVAICFANLVEILPRVAK